jgi:hypothetical protein
MARLLARAIIPAGLLAATAAAVPAAAAQPAPAGAWREFAVPVRGEVTLDGVVAPGRDDAWAAGFTIPSAAGSSAASSLIRSAGQAPARPPGTASSCQTQGLSSLMLHWNGHAWQRATVPDLGRIDEISAADATSIWAVADCGLLRWNGTSWRSVSFPEPKAQQAGASYVTADRPDDVWLTGATYNSVTQVQQAFVDHWNGRRWTLLTLPRLGTAYSLDAVAAQGSGDAWVAGTDYTGDLHNPAQPERLILLHWNGRSWTRISEPATGMWTKRVTSLVIRSAGDVWMTGWAKVTPGETALRHPLLLHWNGRTWTSTPVPAGSGEIYQMAPASQSLWAVGDTFSPSLPSYKMDFLRWTGSRWVNAPIPPHGNDGSLFSDAPAPGGGLWAVGATGGTANTPVIALWH